MKILKTAVKKKKVNIPWQRELYPGIEYFDE